jgi:hypothetical protein
LFGQRAALEMKRIIGVTDNDMAIVEWLREMADEYDHGHHESWPTIDAFNQAADRIEAQAAEIKRLKCDHASAVAELNKTRAWLKDKIEIIKSSRRTSSDDKLEDDEDYRALRRVYEYVTGEEYDAATS